MVIAHLFLFCPTIFSMLVITKEVIEDTLLFFTVCNSNILLSSQKLNTSPYNNHSQVGKVLGTSMSELYDGKRTSWKYPWEKKYKVSSNLDLNWQFFLFKNRVYFLRSAQPMRTNHFHLQMYFRREEAQYVKLLFSSNQPSKFLYISFIFNISFLM